jgi:hypothetical protein
MRVSTTLLAAALAAALAAVSTADARSGHGGGGRFGGGFGGKPVAAFPGAKPTTTFRGGGHGRGFHGGGGHGRGFHGGGGHRPGFGGHHGGGHGRHGGDHGHSHRGHPWWGWGLGVGIGVGWPYWGWGYPYYPYYPYPGYVANETVYVNPVPMPAYGSEPHRYYCPPVAAYYPEVTECTQPWLKVIPNGSGPAAPPVTREPALPAEPATPAEPSRPAPSGVPRSSPAPASGTMGRATSPVRIAAPRMTPPAQLASRPASQQMLSSR